MVQSDNRLVVAYITKQEGTKSLRLLLTTHRILELASRYQINLVARYLPGRYNDTADGLSRSKELTEWTLSQEILQVIFKKMGTPEVDLFASVRSAIVHRYVSEDGRDRDL
ncbi:putative transposon Ty3-I Gag-Pol polyprotein [Operophtera brumata]|uniref:Putative transposon Ty3-I Gag-Pol polyprotein n=1 Tax=Operophtera brumata TaxID=104452 RepID=A0A0L7LSY3_OPEBR|nr:putative transposon Ty3-I Gag-Pol polyprotein [Operophtera brumata]